MVREISRTYSTPIFIYSKSNERYHGTRDICLVSTTNLTEGSKRQELENQASRTRAFFELNSSGLLSMISAEFEHQSGDRHAGSLKGDFFVVLSMAWLVRFTEFLDKLWSIWKKPREEVNETTSQGDQKHLNSKNDTVGEVIVSRAPALDDMRIL
jgi:hypothetical protein